MPKVKLDSRWQIVVPAEVRRALGLEPGDVLDVEVEGNCIVVSRQDPMDPLGRLRSLRGTLPAGLGGEVLRERARWDDAPRDR